MLALHGASEGTRDFELYEHLHRRLATIGVGVVTYDRRGEGRSTGDPSVGRFDVQADDALAVLRTLEVAHIALWGFSQGAWIAPVVAVRDPRVACLVELASAGVTPARQMLYGVAEHLRRAGFGEAAVEEATALRVAFHDAVHGRCTDEPSFEAQLRSASREPWWPLAYLPTRLPGPRERARWIEEMDYDPIPSFLAVEVPVLLFYGESDEWTPVTSSAEAWSAAQGDNATVTIVSGVGHDLRGPGGDVASLYDERLLSWLDATLPKVSCAPRGDAA